MLENLAYSQRVKPGVLNVLNKIKKKNETNNDHKLSQISTSLIYVTQERKSKQEK